MSFYEGVRRERGRFGFQPATRFRFFDGSFPDDRTRPLRGAEIAQFPLETPRSIDWLTGFRCRSRAKEADGSTKTKGKSRHPKRITARDHALLELLVTVVYERGREDSGLKPVFRRMGLSETQCAIKLSAVMAILHGSGLQSTMLVEDSLRRIRASTFTLPSYVVPKSRKSIKTRIAEKRVETGQRQPEPKLTGPVYAPVADGTDRKIHRELEAEEAKANGIRRKPQVYGEAVVEDRRRRRPARWSPPNLGRYLKSVDPVVEPEAWADSLPNETAFRPLPSFALVDTSDGVWLAFELAPQIRSMLIRERLVKMKRVPYAMLDLSALASFTSQYTAPLYKYLLVMGFDEERRRPRYDETWPWEPTPDDIARIVSYARQDGGWRGQVDRNVVQRAVGDIGALKGLGRHLTLTETSTPKKNFAFEVGLPVPTLSKIGTAGTKLSPEDLEELMPPDVAPYGMQITPLLKAKQVLRLGVDATKLLATAWRAALDEIHNESHPYYGDVTGNGRGRKRRGGNLRRRIYDVGAETALLEFALEEDRVPDLTRPEVIDRLELEGTVDAAHNDRIYRLAEISKGYGPKRAHRERRFDIEDEMAIREDRRAAVRQELEQDATRRREARGLVQARIRDGYVISERNLDRMLKRRDFDRLTIDEQARFHLDDGLFVDEIEALVARVSAREAEERQKAARQELGGKSPDRNE